MKTLLIFTGLIAIVLASTVNVKLTKQQPLQQNAKGILEFQRAILRLLRNVYDPNRYEDQVKIGETYDIETHIDSFTNPQAVREFMDLNRLGFLPKGEIFSIFNEEQRRQAIALFNVLYYATDFATLYRTACWARLFMNEGMFVYSLSVALVQRPDTAFIDLPPIYEILPNYFFDMTVIQKAEKAREMYRKMPRPMEMPEIQDQRPLFQNQNPVFQDQRPMFQDQRPLFQNEPSQEQIPEQRPKYDEERPIYQETTPEMEQMRTPYMRDYETPMQNTEFQNPWMGVPYQTPMYRMPTENPMPEQMNDMLRSRMLPWYYLLPESVRTQQQWFNQFKYGKYMQDKLQEEKLMDEQLRVRRDQPEMMMPNRFPRTGIVIDANWTETTDLPKDYALSYFMNDIGLNAYYYYYNLYFPFWLPNDMIYMRTDRRGEQFYYVMQQLLARFYLERLSNGLGRIPTMNFKQPINPEYKPTLNYPNGMNFPERQEDMLVTKQRTLENMPRNYNYTNGYMFIKDYERRIRDAIDLGYVMTPTGKQIRLFEQRGFEMLGNMIEGNMESPNLRFYGCLQIFARYLLGNSQNTMEEYKIAPSVLEHFETSLRDPVFYQFYMRMMMYFERYMNYVPPYSTKELLMAGVKIQDVLVDPLVTYFDYFYTDITNALKVEKMGENMGEIPVRVRQLRLNNKPFKYEMYVMCDKPYEALVKVFLGPKLDEQGRRLDMTENRLNFVELDRFRVELLAGANKIKRRSRDSFYCNDRTSGMELYKRIMIDMTKPDFFEYEPREPEWSMPRRLLLPKGTETGMTYQMYFMISPYKPMKEIFAKNTYKTPVMNYRRINDDYPLGYPLDRPLDETVFYVPNSMFKDVKIYHAKMDDMLRMKMDL